MEGTTTRRKALSVALAIMLALALAALFACAGNQQQSSSQSSGQASEESAGQQLTVPNVASLTQADAEKAIVAAGFELGEVTTQNSDDIPLGSVLSQKPEPFTAAQRGSKVDIVISAGKAAPKQVDVPDLVGMTQAQAEEALKDVGLVSVAPDTEETTEVDPGLVCDQSIAAGTSVDEGTRVKFTIATAPSTITVPDVCGMTEADAEAAITDADLGYDVTRTYSQSVDEGLVMAQSIDAGTGVQAGTTVVIAISLGNVPSEQVSVPDVSTYSWSDAEATLEAAGLEARHTGDPAGVVVYQDIPAGTEVDEDTVVTVTLAKETASIPVPNLVGMTVSSAEVQTDAVGLGLDISGSSDGTIDSQWPDPGTNVDPGTTVQVTVK